MKKRELLKKIEAIEKEMAELKKPISNIEVDFEKLGTVSDRDNCMVFEKSKLVEIIPQEEIDWSIPQKVVYKGIIVQTTGEHTENDFTGIILNNTSYYRYRESNLSRTWYKRVFKPFKGEIIIKGQKNKHASSNLKSVKFKICIDEIHLFTIFG